jgi:hypothetical protein
MLGRTVQMFTRHAREGGNPDSQSNPIDFEEEIRRTNWIPHFLVNDGISVPDQ